LSATIAGNSCSHLRDGDFIAGSNVDWSRSITSVSRIIGDLDNACHGVESTGMPTHLAICSKARSLAADGLIGPYAWDRSVRLSVRPGL
jgi:hypothetical protein